MNSRIKLTITAVALLNVLAAGCAAPRVTLPYTELQFKAPARGVQPVLLGSINGVSGHFVMDTGAMGPILTHAAIQRCSIATTASEGFAVGVGGRVAMLQANNVTVSLAQNVTVHWRTVLVLPTDASTPTGTNSDILGLLDYHTLAALHAVMDMDHKTVTLTP